ncbi:MULTISPECIES: hypothetical protein [unclassified Neisseria]|uniref:hypothetical protein n=1 Tax=unclassified Neisseria TaxID=2623750 RepID=UPI00266531F3|nr:MULTISPECIES: hypothetical protein [unclassified Neisseria]MDO1510438.1 hypothetical protein [Neisseria sp. MVDL19-042950]MDO1516607.1 hypothetical protein [Neisseria sp. MVDL18-041461]MDO1563753.1 hypothetical protein [Neisseria sp. MVDL20-010259]
MMMKKMVLIFTASSFLAACAQMFPARSEYLGGNRYQLESSGNIFASKQTLKNLIDKKAKKLCPNGYQYETDDGLKYQKETFYHNNQPLPSDYLVMKQIVRCN